MGQLEVLGGEEGGGDWAWGSQAGLNQERRERTTWTGGMDCNNSHTAIVHST
jgi:hypothetical protein